MTTTERRLTYIANSPPREHGGFHDETIKAAKSALKMIERLRKLVMKKKR